MRNPIKTIAKKFGNRRQSTYVATLFNFEAQAETREAAEQSLLAMVDRVSRHQSPKVYTHRGNTLVFSVTADGCHYIITSPDDDGPKWGGTLTTLPDTEALAGAVRHLLSISREPGEYDVPSWATMLNPTQTAEEWRSDDAWQAAYLDAIRCGQDKNGAHAYACDHRLDYFGQTVNDIAAA